MTQFVEKYVNPFTDEDSVKSYRDLKNSLDTAREEGIEIVLQVFDLAKRGKGVDEISAQVGISTQRVREIMGKMG